MRCPVFADSTNQACSLARGVAERAESICPWLCVPPRARSLKLFQQRKPSVTTEWQSKLPDFVRRLEEALYRSAASKVGGCTCEALPPRCRAGSQPSATFYREVPAAMVRGHAAHRL